MGLFTKSQHGAQRSEASRSNSPPAADQTVWDLPTTVGRSLRPDGYPKSLIMIARKSYAKVSNGELE